MNTWTWFRKSAIAVALGVTAAMPAQAQPTLQRQPTLGGARGVIVEEIVNEHPAFMVRVDVDHADRVYQAGEEMKVTVHSAKPGYLYLFYCDAEGKASCLFPNRVQTENKIPANVTIHVPGADSGFRLRVGRPFGREDLKAVVTLQPLACLSQDSLTKGDVTPLTVPKLKGVEVEVVDHPQSWAEHHVEITTVEHRSPRVEPRRIGVFIGISDFVTVRKLAICHKDAEQLAAVMKNRCQLDEAMVLTDRQATLAAIEDAIRNKLPAASKPGDTVFIYWSGHGGRCADDNGDEADGYDEFLIPYDGNTDDIDTMRKTMLLDDTFGRWIQALDGRKVVVILDTCHSGGQAAGSKGIRSSTGTPKSGSFDFLDGELKRTKDIGQKETAILAGSKATQVSFEREEDDLSVMTYYLIEQLKEGSGSVSLADAFRSLSDKVPNYTQRVFSETQTPVLVDQTTPPVYLRP